MGLSQLPKRYHPDFRRLNQVPVGPVEIDYLNRLSQGIVCYALPAGNTHVELVRRQLGTQTGVSREEVNRHGKTVLYYAMHDGETIPEFVFGSGDSWSISFLAFKETPGDRSGNILGDASNNNSYLYLKNDEVKIEYSDAGGGPGSKASFTLDIAQDVLAWRTMTYDGTTTRLYEEGVENTSGSNVTDPDGALTINALAQGHTDEDRALQGELSTVIIHNRVLGLEEVQLLHTDPYQTLKPATPLSYFPPSEPIGTLTGTVIGSDESDIVTGGKTVVLTVDNDTWVAAGAPFDAVRQDIIDGLDSASSETFGWNAEVRDKEVVTAVTRTSDTVVTVTLSASASYGINANETITATLPVSALVKAIVPVITTPTFIVANLASTSALTGTAIGSDESDIVTGGNTVILTLTNDRWADAGAPFDAVRQDIIDGLDSASSETFGWNNEVRDKEVVTSVVRTSDTVVTVTLSASADYGINANETITATVPVSALAISTAPVIAAPTFVVANLVSASVLTGTVIGSDESDIVAGGSTVILTLTNDRWADAGATFDAVRQDIIDGLDSAGVETFGWNNEVRDKEVVTAVARTSDTVVTVTLSASADYGITANETITATVPASALAIDTSPVVATPTFAITNLATTTALTGTVTTADEADIVTGGNTVILTLTNDRWAASGGTFDAIRQDIIDGLDSAQSETFGWNNEVRDKEVVGAVVRTSDTVVTVTLSASASYGITANETITATVPASALAIDTSPVVAAPTFAITNLATTTALTGTVTTADENDIMGGGETIILTLTNDKWVASGGTFDAVRQDIIDGLDSAQSETFGWNNEVRDKEVVTAVVRTSDTVVTVTLSSSAGYGISANETITATVPASALAFDTTPVIAAPTFSITDVASTASLTGTVIGSDEGDIVTGGRTVILTLMDDTWVTAGATFDAVRQDIIDGLDSAGAELLGWNNEVRDKEVVTSVVRTSDTVVTVTLSASASYDIAANETITATIPDSALTIATSPLVAAPTFAIATVTATAALSGTILLADENAIVLGASEIILTLTNDTWVAAGATFDATRQAIIDGMTSATSLPLGWNDEVRDKEVVTAVVRTSDTVVTISLSPAVLYDIAAIEIVTVTIPAAAMALTSTDVVSVPTFAIAPVGGGLIKELVRGLITPLIRSLIK